jgi:tight adherence protein C
VSSSVVLAGALGAVALAIVLLVAVAAAPAKSAQGGIARAAAAIERHYARRAEAAGPGAASQLAAPPGWLRALALRLSPSGAVESLERRLDMAGNPKRWNADRILAAKAFGLLVVAGLAGLAEVHKPALAVLAAVVGGAVGFYVPSLLLVNVGSKRQARLQLSLPDAMDMLTVCVEAGLGFDAALAKVAVNTTGPLADELARTLQEMQIGKSRTEALRAMADRTSVPELRGFVSALVQAGELGIPIASVLREQSNEMRLRRRQRAEEKAQKVPVKILIPLIGCLFPALFIIVIGPGAILIMHSAI